MSLVAEIACAVIFAFLCGGFAGWGFAYLAIQATSRSQALRLQTISAWLLRYPEDRAVLEIILEKCKDESQ